MVPLPVAHGLLQGHRGVTPIYCIVLDAISEEINNHIFRQGHGAVGLSAASPDWLQTNMHSLLRTIMPDDSGAVRSDKELK
jgi:hypothetical protein